MMLSILTRSFSFLFFAGSFLLAEPVEKAVKYHGLLLKNADNETLMDRFLDAWLDEGDREALEDWLGAEAEAGGAAERRVLARYLDHIGSQEKALEQFEAVLKLEPGDEKTQLAVARLQAAGLDFEGALKTLGAREDVEAVTLRGSYEHRLGNTKVALKLWGGLLAEKPKDRELREDLVSLFRQEGLGKEARELQKELIAMGKDPFQRALDQLDLGDLELEGGLKDEALVSYREVLAASGSGSWLEREALHKLQEIFRRGRDANGLGVFLAKLREEMPHRLALQKSFARQLIMTDRVDEGVAVFREVLRRTPGDEGLRMEFVELLDLAGRDEEAAEEMEALMASGAKAEQWLRLAELRQDFDEEAVPEALGEFEKLKAGEAAGVLEVARVYDRFDLDDEVLRVLELGREEHADSREISEALAVLLVGLERKKEALVIWDAMAKKGGIDEVLRVAESKRRLGLIEEAFALLSQYRKELEENFGGLRLYCDVAFDSGETEAAWTGVRQLVTLAKGFSDLQVAVDLGAVIGRKLGLGKAISELEKVDQENDLCLLATLQQLGEILPEADATLARAKGELARRHRVVLLTRRGDYDGAIKQLRTMMGKRVSLVERRQLLDLLMRQRDYEGALAEVEQWKISAPGEVQAWQKRASLLTQLGRQKEAESELRRARNIFGRDDMALTRELAKMQLPLGRHREALRLYEHLFRTAQTDEDRLGLIDEMYAAAEQAGLQEELITRFEQEHAKAKRELFPLRSLARLYKLSRDSGGQQNMLQKLYRLQPDDEKVLFELVELAESHRDSAGARKLLLDHSSRTSSVGLLRRLASMQFKAGEIDAGLKILSKIAPADLKAGDVESTAWQLWQMKEHQLALEFLEENQAVVSADWRLRLLFADFLAMVDRGNEAWGVWVDLLGAEGALGRPLIKSSSYPTIIIPADGQMSERYWRLLIGADLFSKLSQTNGQSISRISPKDANEVRWLSLARLARASLRADPSGESWGKFMETLSHPWLAKVRGWGLFPKNVVKPSVVKEDVKMTPGMRLRSLIVEPESSREDFLKLATEVENENLHLAKLCRIHAALKLPQSEEQLKALREIAVQMADGGGARDIYSFTQLIWPQFDFGIFSSLGKELPSPEQQEIMRALQPLWKGLIEGAVAEDSFSFGGGHTGYALGLQRLSGDMEGLFQNLDRLLEVKPASKLNAKPNPSSHYLQPLGGIPDQASLLSQMTARHFIYSLIYRANAPQLIPPAALEKARENGWEPKGYGKLEEFVLKIPEVKDGFLRALLFYKVGMTEEFLAEMEALGEKGTLQDQLDALAFRHMPDQRGENVELLRALLAMDRTGLSAAELSLLDEVTLGEALKNRRLREVDDQVKAGLEKILSRFAKGKMDQSKTSMLRSLSQSLGLEVQMPKAIPRSRARSRQRQSYRQLLSAGSGAAQRGRESEQEQLERRLMDQLSRCFSASDPLLGLQQLAGREEFRGLKEKALTRYEPGESRSYLKRVRYAQLSLVLGDRQKAREVLVRLQAERPYDAELGFLVLLAQSPEERAAELDELLRSGSLAKVIDRLVKLARGAEEEDPFFEAYERLVLLMKERADEFTPKNVGVVWQTFQTFENMSKSFDDRSLHRMSSRLPKVKEGQDSKLGDWALRTRQRKILLEAFGEMMRFRSIRDQVMSHLNVNLEALRLSTGNVEWLVFDLLKKEPVKDVDSERDLWEIISRYQGRRSGGHQQNEYAALKAVLDSEAFSEESVDELVRHDFLSEKQGDLVKAALESDVEKIEKLLAEFHEERKAGLPKVPQQAGLLQRAPSLNLAQINLRSRWDDFVETLVRAKRWEDPVRETLGNGMAAFKSEQELSRLELLRVCELGKLEESLAALEAAAAAYFPEATMYESYEELKAAGAVPLEIEVNITAGQSLFAALQNVPRAWIPLLTFLENSDRAVWLKLDESRIRSQLQLRLDVMYKSVFYNRLGAEGLGGYDGLALLGAEIWTNSGEVSSWFEVLLNPLKLSPTEGRTYWADVSEDCQKQVEKVTYLEAFMAMRKDFRMDDEGRQKLLRRVLESELEKLSGLNEGQLKGLANLVKKDFPKLEVPKASEELEDFLQTLRSLPVEGVVERIRDLMASDQRMKSLDDNQSKGLCTRLAAEGEVVLAAEFWVAFLKMKASKGRRSDFSSSNHSLLARKPFMGTLDLADSVRFVRLVREAFQGKPEMVKSITYTRDMLGWRKALEPYIGYKANPDGVVAFLDKMLERDGIADADKRVIGGFLIKADLSGRPEKASEEAFRLRMKDSPLAAHSPGVVETMLAISQLQGTREKEEDVKALKVIHGYLRDQELESDFRADLAQWLMGKFERDEVLRQLVDAEPIGIALRDLLLRSSYGAIGNLHTAGPMMHFVNQHLATASAELQQEIYEAWTAALKADAGRVLREKVGPNRSLRLSDIIFDFTDGGRRFPLPPQLTAELTRSFVGDLEMMQRLIRTGNAELVAGLLPDHEKRRFQLMKREYSAATLELANEVLPVLPAMDQVMLKCYLATLQDARDWKDQEESAGHLQHERAVAAAEAFVANPPEEQAVRVSAITYLHSSVEALTVLMPFLNTELQDDLPTLARNYNTRGDVRFMLRWVKAGGGKSIHTFGPNAERPLKLSGIYGYTKELAELERLLAPSLKPVERMQFTCDLALLRDPQGDLEKEGEIPTRETRIQLAARYILENPLTGADREAEKRCIAKLVKGGLAEAEALALMERDAKNLGELDVAGLAALRQEDIELLALQLRNSISEGDTEGVMICFRILADPEAGIRDGIRVQLMDFILPKIVLPLIGQTMPKEGDSSGEKLLAELKSLSAKLFQMTFVEGLRVREPAQRAVLFCTFAAHCLAEDKVGYEALEKTVTKEGGERLGRLTKSRSSGSFSNRGETLTSPAAQPLNFDGKEYHLDEFKGLRKLLFEKILAQSFTALPAGLGEVGAATLLESLNLKLGELNLKREAFASERGNFHSIVSALLLDDDDLFLALLPTQEEAFSRGNPLTGRRSISSHQPMDEPGVRILGRNWMSEGGDEDLDLIESDFQRMHFEIYAQSFSAFYGMKDWAFDLRKYDAEMEQRILELLPESGAARTQIFARLGRMIKPGSKLAEALVTEASAEGFWFAKTPESPQVLSQGECLDLFIAGWTCAMHSGDWSVLERQLKGELDEYQTKFLAQCAGVHALYLVAGEDGLSEELFEKLASFGVKKTEPEYEAWFEILGLIGAAETSTWKEHWLTLDASEKLVAQGEMAARLTGVLGALASVQLSYTYGSRTYSGSLWKDPLGHDTSARAIKAIMDDDLGVFEAVQISPKARVQLILSTFDWQQMRSCIETRFEGEDEIALLTELALKSYPRSASRDDFKVFVSGHASRVKEGSEAASKLWLKVLFDRISSEDQEGVKAAREKINLGHLKEYEVDNLKRRLERFEAPSE